MSRLPRVTRSLLAVPVAIASILLASVAVAQSKDNVRRLPLQGTRNLRDIGGYATTDGKHVKWRQVYRSGQLAQLTDKDYEYLAEVGISAICDFRSEDERRAAPTNWRGPNQPDMLWLPRQPATTATPASATTTRTLSARELVASGASGEEVAASMRAAYEQYIVVFAPSYGAVIRRILQDRGPTLYHCSAGKDRTGTFSALLLLMLGVPRETVFEDYLLTNDYIGTTERIAATAKDLKATPEAARPLMVADRTYLEAALQAIDRTFGSLDNYRRVALKVSDEDLRRLRARLLED
jgi:protein-tyrosine phosphatase